MIRLSPLQLIEFASRHSLSLGASGRPYAPLVTVDLGTPAEPEIAAAAAAAAARSGVICVGVADTQIDEGWGPLLETLTLTLVGRPVTSPPAIAVSDVEGEVATIEGAVRRNPRAALTLAAILRAASQLPVVDALVVESAAYSMLLAGPEFAAWRATRPARHSTPAPGPAVLLTRDGPALEITLNRPERHNAFDVEIRDGLIDGLDLALCDESIERILLKGAGPSFCSGGDLDEFGTSPDVATAHLIRLDRSVAARIHRASARTSVLLHGACIGAGIEFPSFAHRVEAREDAFFQLPEISMGLIPGAGGTVGISGRIGRWRTAYLCLSGGRLAVETALDWKLLDGRAAA